MDTNLLKPLTRWCEINLDLLSENIDKAKKLISHDTKIMAVIKTMLMVMVMLLLPRKWKV